MLKKRSEEKRRLVIFIPYTLPDEFTDSIGYHYECFTERCSAAWKRHRSWQYPMKNCDAHLSKLSSTNMRHIKHIKTPISLLGAMLDHGREECEQMEMIEEKKIFDKYQRKLEDIHKIIDSLSEDK